MYVYVYGSFAKPVRPKVASLHPAKPFAKPVRPTSFRTTFCVISFSQAFGSKAFGEILDTALAHTGVLRQVVPWNDMI